MAVIMPMVVPVIMPVIGVTLLMPVIMRFMGRVRFTVFHAVNDRAGCHEQQRLKERVCNQMEGCGDIAADTQRRHHETKL